MSDADGRSNLMKQLFLYSKREMMMMKLLIEKKEKTLQKERLGHVPAKGFKIKTETSLTGKDGDFLGRKNFRDQCYKIPFYGT